MACPMDTEQFNAGIAADSKDTFPFGEFESEVLAKAERVAIVAIAAIARTRIFFIFVF